MREKKWIDCPVCGAKKSMLAESNRSERFHPSGYPPLDIGDLNGTFCSECGDGFWSLASERQIARQLAEHCAAHDATRIVAAELASVQEAAKAMHVTVQGIHKMMNEGRLRYVVAGDTRLPIRKDVQARTAARRA